MHPSRRVPPSPPPAWATIPESPEETTEPNGSSSDSDQVDELGSQYAASAAPSLSRQAAQPPPLTRSDLPSPAATRAPPSSQPIHSFQIGARQRNIGNPSPRSIPISATQISSSSSSRPPGGRLNPDRPRAKLPFVQQPAEEIQQQKLSQPVKGKKAETIFVNSDSDLDEPSASAPRVPSASAPVRLATAVSKSDIPPGCARKTIARQMPGRKKLGALEGRGESISFAPKKGRGRPKQIQNSSGSTPSIRTSGVPRPSGGNTGSSDDDFPTSPEQILSLGRSTQPSSTGRAQNTITSSPSRPYAPANIQTASSPTASPTKHSMKELLNITFRNKPSSSQITPFIRKNLGSSRLPASQPVRLASDIGRPSTASAGPAVIVVSDSDDEVPTLNKTTISSNSNDLVIDLISSDSDEPGANASNSRQPVRQRNSRVDGPSSNPLSTKLRPPSTGPKPSSIDKGKGKEKELPSTSAPPTRMDHSPPPVPSTPDTPAAEVDFGAMDEGDDMNMAQDFMPSAGVNEGSKVVSSGTERTTEPTSSDTAPQTTASEVEGSSNADASATRLRTMQGQSDDDNDLYVRDKDEVNRNDANVGSRLKPMTNEIAPTVVQINPQTRSNEMNEPSTIARPTTLSSRLEGMNLSPQVPVIPNEMKEADEQTNVDEVEPAATATVQPPITRNSSGSLPPGSSPSSSSSPSGAERNAQRRLPTPESKLSDRPWPDESVLVRMNSARRKEGSDSSPQPASSSSRQNSPIKSPQYKRPAASPPSGSGSWIPKSPPLTQSSTEKRTEEALLTEPHQPRGIQSQIAHRLEDQPALPANASTPFHSIGKPQSPGRLSNPQRLASPFSSLSPTKSPSSAMDHDLVIEEKMDRSRPPSLTSDRLTQMSPQGHAAVLKRALGKFRDAKPTPLTDLLNIRSTESSSNSSPFGASGSLPESGNTPVNVKGPESHKDSPTPPSLREFRIGAKRPADRHSDSSDAADDEPNSALPSPPPRSSASPAPPVARFSVAKKSGTTKRPKSFLRAALSDPLQSLGEDSRPVKRTGPRKLKPGRVVDNSTDEEVEQKSVNQGGHLQSLQRGTRKRLRTSMSNSSTDEDELLLVEASTQQERRRLRPRSHPASGKASSAEEEGGFDFDFEGVDSDLDIFKYPSRVPSPNRDFDDEIDRLAQLSIDKNDPNPELPRCFPFRERNNIYYRNDEVPTEVINMVNAMPEWQRRRNVVALQAMFEAMIISNTADDEPDAPPIRVVNNVDDEATPAWECYYTNKIYHANDVPPPDYLSLKGCNCVGPCNRNSKTCSCIKRQREAYRDGIEEHEGGEQLGFNYDEQGLLIYPKYPVYECNDACGCTEDCTNRVVGRGRTVEVEIQKTRSKGWGVFSPKALPAGQFVGIYAGEILSEAETHTRGLLYNNTGKTYLFDLDPWYLKFGLSEDELKNWRAKYSMDAYHVGNFTRYLNHSCAPNCTIAVVYINDTNIEKPLLAIFTNRVVRPGEELTFSYYGDADDSDDEEDVSVAKDKMDEVYAKCYCGAKKCKGFLFSFS